MRYYSLILWSILLTAIAARYYHRLKHIRLEKSFCTGYQELKDNKCSARLSTCSALEPNELLQMRQVLCGFKFDPAVQTDPPPAQPFHGFYPGYYNYYIPGFHGLSHGFPGLHLKGKYHPNHPKHFADVFEADIHQYRFIASIYSSDRKFLCAGALVSPRTVITSAQCVPEGKRKKRQEEEQVPEGDAPTPPAADGKLVVRFGEQHLNINPPFHKVYEYDVESVEVSQNYEAETHQNDIAILRLVHTVPICLFPPVLIPRKFEYWLDYDHIAGCSSTYMGWGLSNQRPYFRAQTGQVLPQYFCEKLFNWEPGQLHRSQLCVDAPSGVCITDIGGPLITYNKHRWVLIGVLTFGKHCRTPGLPLIFSRVTESFDQIWKYIDQDFNSRNTSVYHEECHHLHDSHHSPHVAVHHEKYQWDPHYKHEEVHPIVKHGDVHTVHPVEAVHTYDGNIVPGLAADHITVEKSERPTPALHGLHKVYGKEGHDGSYKSHGEQIVGGVLPIKHINYEYLK